MEAAMKSQTIAAALALFVAATATAQDDPASANNAVECPSTLSKSGILENDSLNVNLPRKFVFRPGGPGFVDKDGALGMKVGWERKKKGHLQISGRRIDASAPPARAYIYDYGDSGFQPIYLVFPTPGCWEITGEVSGGRLTFVILVEKVSEGPSWRFDGPERGWRVSGGIAQTQ
jgi:hypothetical protein